MSLLELIASLLGVIAVWLTVRQNSWRELRAQLHTIPEVRHIALVGGDFDVLLAASTPCAATPIGAEWFDLGGQRLPVRPNMGVLTQPFSCIGLPVCGVPVWGAHASLPIGVQVITNRYRDHDAIAVAALCNRLSRS